METAIWIALIEVSPSALWVVFALVLVLIFRKRLSSIRFGDNEVVFREAVDMAAADKEFQKAEVQLLLSHATLYGKSTREVAERIIDRAELYGIATGRLEKPR